MRALSQTRPIVDSERSPPARLRNSLPSAAVPNVFRCSGQPKQHRADGCGQRGGRLVGDRVVEGVEPEQQIGIDLAPLSRTVRDGQTRGRADVRPGEIDASLVIQIGTCPIQPVEGAGTEFRRVPRGTGRDRAVERRHSDRLEDRVHIGHATYVRRAVHVLFTSLPASLPDALRSHLRSNRRRRIGTRRRPAAERRTTAAGRSRWRASGSPHRE